MFIFQSFTTVSLVEAGAEHKVVLKRIALYVEYSKLIANDFTIHFHADTIDGAVIRQYLHYLISSRCKEQTMCPKYPKNKKKTKCELLKVSFISKSKTQQNNRTNLLTNYVYKKGANHLKNKCFTILFVRKVNT